MYHPFEPSQQNSKEKTDSNEKQQWSTLFATIFAVLLVLGICVVGGALWWFFGEVSVVVEEEKGGG
jgi:flagellar basal body-associated protein FliL